MSNHESKIDISLLTEDERSTLQSLLFLANIKTKLKEAQKYWDESFNSGDDSSSAQLAYIARECKKAEPNIDRLKLEPTERVTLNNIMILANCIK